MTTTTMISQADRGSCSLFATSDKAAWQLRVCIFTALRCIGPLKQLTLALKL
jgi:hypothetical protein